MRLEVFFQIALQSTGFAAERALMRCEARVHGAMLEQVRLEAKRFAANVAHERLLIGVNDGVLLKA